MATKQLLTRPSKQNPHSLEVYFEGGGEVPESLSGLYTHQREATLAIQSYLNSRTTTRGKRNG